MLSSYRTALLLALVMLLRALFWVGWVIGYGRAYTMMDESQLANAPVEIVADV
jgi:hypothetical protein